MKNIQINRQELYELVWTEPISQLTKKFNISDYGMRIICKKYNIPLPKLGYWQKVQFKKPTTKGKLPEHYKGDNNIKLQFRDDEEVIIRKAESQKKIMKNEIQKVPILPLKVPERLTNPDPLIIQAQKTLVNQEIDAYRYIGMVKTNSEELNIRVTPSNISRALRFMDTFIKMLRFQKHDILIKYSKTFAVIYDVEVEISFKEKMKIVTSQEKYVSHLYRPTGVLAFKVEVFLSQKEWKDETELIEFKLSNILVYLESKCFQRSKEIIEERRVNQIRKQEELRAKELDEQKQMELNAFKVLLNQAHRWSQAKFMRDYLSNVIQNTGENLSMNPELQNWIGWAKQKIDWYDPLVMSKDEILNDSDRNKVDKLVIL